MIVIVIIIIIIAIFFFMVIKLLNQIIFNNIYTPNKRQQITEKKNQWNC